MSERKITISEGADAVTIGGFDHVQSVKTVGVSAGAGRFYIAMRDGYDDPFLAIEIEALPAVIGLLQRLAASQQKGA